jgi:hypothetical protein
MTLPKHLLTIIYSFDSTYHEIFRVVLDELKIFFNHKEELQEINENQHMEKYVFNLYADRHIKYLLGYSSD